MLVVAVVGPTAAGKSALSLTLAEELGGEVVNADSMQLYRGMDVGTAKLTPAGQRGIPHHLLSVWDVTRTASVADYQRLARAAVDDILARDRVPLLVGGSGLYVRAVLDDLTFPGTDPRLRAELEAELARHGPGPLHERLQRADPAAAAAILPSNGRRIVRALEVYALTGRPFRARLPDPAPVYPSVQLVVDHPDLAERIAVRVERMWAAGLVAEVRALVGQGIREGRTARAALGYQQVLAYLAGEVTEAEAHQETVRATRRFARRQRSWFRRSAGAASGSGDHPEAHWLDGAAPDLAARALAMVRADLLAA